jgi:hypothetical protein
MSEAEARQWYERPLDWRKIQIRLKKGEKWVEVRWVTPAEAAEWLLERNSSNRKLRQTQVQFLAGEVMARRWNFNNDCITFDEHCVLQNGQHRLAACVMADIPILVGVMFGTSVDADMVTDIQARRALRDQLHKRDVKQTAVAASCCNLGWRWEYGDPLRNKVNPSYPVALKWLDQNPSIPEEIKATAPAVKNLKIPPTPITVVYHQLVLIEKTAAKDFLNLIAHGEGLADGDPPLALRNWLFRQMRDRVGRNTDQDTYHALLIKAWNAWVTGKRMKEMTWRRRGIKREDFPQLVDLDENPWTVISELPPLRKHN